MIELQTAWGVVAQKKGFNSFAPILGFTVLVLHLMKPTKSWAYTLKAKLSTASSSEP